MHLITRRTLAVALAITSVVGAGVSTAHAATNTTISFSLDKSYLYAVGMDKVYANGSSPGGYEKIYEYPAKRPASNPTTTLLPDPPRLNVSDAQTLSQIRLEFYNRCAISVCTENSASPNYYQYRQEDPGDSMVALRITPAANVNLGRIPFPKSTDANYASLKFNIVSTKPIFDRRLKITIFQTTQQPKTSTGYAVDAEAHGYNAGSVYQSSGLWNGKYLAFIYDYENGVNKPYTHRVLGLVDVRGNTTTTLDLDASCFGIDECLTLEPTPSVPGEFHPVTPSRIVDSRVNRGIAGIVQPGDGRLADPNPVHRLATRLNHEFKVTGVGGVPTSGVSSVLLNITALGAAKAGSLAIIQKPPRVDSVFQDQGSFRSTPTAVSQLNWLPGDVVSGQVLVRVGVGGRVRVVNRSFGATHLLVDVVGWYDESQGGQNGLGLVAVQPTRVVDSRSGVGTSLGAFAPNQQRTVQLRPSAVVPNSAEALVASVGVSPISGTSFATVWPATASKPGTATVAATPGQSRSNMVTTPLSAGGAWSLFNGATTSHLSVDLQGYFAAQSGSSGRVTTVNPVKVYGAGGLGANATATVNVSSKLSGIANPVAVYVNVSLTGVKGTGYLTTDASSGPTGVVALRYNPSRDRSNLVLVRLAPGGTFKVRNVGAGGGTLTVDLVGVVTG